MRKKLPLILATIVISVMISGCLFEECPTHIKNGFGDNLVDMLYDKYELRIPPSAKFIKGYFDNAFRDPSVYIAFTVPQKDFEAMFTNNWDEPDGVYGHEWYQTLFNDIVLENCYKYKKEGYTVTFFSIPIDGIITCAFIGHHPGNSIR